MKDIMKDPLFLQQKSEPATEADRQVSNIAVSMQNADFCCCVATRNLIKSNQGYSIANGIF